MEGKRAIKKRIREYLLESLSNKYGVEFIFVQYGDQSHGIRIKNFSTPTEHPLFDSRDIYRTEAFLDMLLQFDYYALKISQIKNS